MKDSDPPIPSRLLFPHSFLILLIVSFPFFLYAWIMEHPFMKIPFIFASLQCVFLTLFSSFFGATFVLANRFDRQSKSFMGWYGWRVTQRFSFVIFVAFWIFFFYSWNQPAWTICLELTGLGLWSLVVSILASRKYRKRGWGLYWDKRQHLSRKQRERMEREARKKGRRRLTGSGQAGMESEIEN